MKTNFVLVLIIIFSAILRLYGISYDLPYVFNPDEPYIMDRVAKIADVRIRHGIILRGPLPYYIIGTTIKASSVFFPSILQNKSNFQESYAFNKSIFYIIGRTISAMYSVAGIIILFFLGKILVDTRTGLLASFLLSISSMDINLAHQVTPDTALSTSLLMTLLLILLAFKKNNVRFFYLSAIFTGISTGQKTTGIVLLPILIFAFLYFSFRNNPGTGKKIRVLFLILTCIVLTYLLIYPFVITSANNIASQWKIENDPTSWGELIIRDLGISGRMIKYIFEDLHHGTGTFILFTGISAMIIALIRRNLLEMLLILFSQIFVLGISLPIPNYDRWVLPLVPIICFFSAKFCYEIYSKFRKLGNYGFSIFAFPVVLTSIVPLAKSVLTTDNFKAKDTRTLEIEWMRENNIDESEVLRDRYTSTNPPEDKLITKIPPDRLRDYKYFIASSYYYKRFTQQKDITPDKYELYNFILNKTKKVKVIYSKEFHPTDNDISLLVSGQLFKIPATKGPTLDIQQL